MTVVFPEGVSAFGTTSVAVVQTIANTSAPTLTEINAATSVNVSCFLVSGGVGTVTTNKGNPPRRLCTTAQFESFGTSTYSVSDLTYLYSPQGDDADVANKAKVALEEGTDVYLVVRRGLSAEDEPFAVGDKVDIWHVTLGPQNEQPTGDGEFDLHAIVQPSAVKSKPVKNVTIAA